MPAEASPAETRPSRRAFWRGRLFRFAALLAALFALGVLVRCNADEWLFMWPSRAAFPTPAGYEDVAITTPDGLVLHGWFVRAADAAAGEARPCVVQTHGNAGALPDHAPSAVWLAHHGFHVLTFDYRDYGRSDPASGERREDLAADARAAIDYAASRPDVDARRLGVIGFSLGSGLGLAASADDPRVRAVVAHAGFDRWKAIANRHAPLLGGLLVRDGLDPADSAARLGERPLLVIHGDADRIVPIEHGRAVYEAAKAAGVDARFVPLPGVRHNDPVWLDLRFTEPVAAFFARAFATGGEGPVGSPE